MIPYLVTVRYRRPNGRWRRWYVPVPLVVLVLSPLLLLAVLGGAVACFVFQVRLVGALRGIGQLLGALPGARFEVEEGRTALLISVR
jgi:hypothetical protein